MVEGSIYVEHKIFVIVASASHNFLDDCLNDLHARIHLKSFASMSDGPSDPFVLSGASLVISPSISLYIITKVILAF